MGSIHKRNILPKIKKHHVKEGSPDPIPILQLQPLLKLMLKNDTSKNNKNIERTTIVEVNFLIYFGLFLTKYLTKSIDNPNTSAGITPKRNNDPKIKKQFPKEYPPRPTRRVQLQLLLKLSNKNHDSHTKKNIEKTIMVEMKLLTIFMIIT